MPNSIVPTTIGSLPSTSTFGSTLVLGKDVTADFEAVGLGIDGRPDVLNLLQINLSQYDPSSDGNLLPVVSFIIDPLDILELQKNNPAITSPIFLNFKEVAICETDDEGNSTEKRMIVLASDTYLPPS